MRTVLVLGWLTVLLNPIFAQQTQKRVALHQAVGEVIDAEENQRYHLFSQDLGLVAATVYRTQDNQWRLHLRGSKNNKSWALTRKLSPAEHLALQRRIQRVEDAKAAGRPVNVATPVLPVTLPVEALSDQPTRVTLTDNTKLLGRIVGVTEEGLTFVTASDLSMQIPDDKIKDISWPRGELTEKGFQLADPNPTRLFFGPTGRTLREGEFNFSDFYIFFPALGVGLTDFLMIGGGISLFPGATEQAFYLTGKARVVHTSRVDLAAGLFVFGVPDEEAFTSVYAALSTGSPRGGMTFGVALPLSDETANAFGVLVGGETQVSAKIKLMSENWFFFGDGDALALLSGGLRFLGERFSVGLALFTSPDAFEDEGFPFLPWLDFALSLGK